jgi:hypothetical protein
MAMTGNRSSCRFYLNVHIWSSSAMRKKFRAWEEEHCHLSDMASGEAIGNGNSGVWQRSIDFLVAMQVGLIFHRVMSRKPNKVLQTEKDSDLAI